VDHCQRAGGQGKELSSFSVPGKSRVPIFGPGFFISRKKNLSTQRARRRKGRKGFNRRYDEGELVSAFAGKLQPSGSAARATLIYGLCGLGVLARAFILPGRTMRSDATGCARLYD
jgi:hypothetical protein